MTEHAPIAVAALFTQPVVAFVLGLLLGFGMLALTRVSIRFMTPEEPELGVARAVALSMLGLVVAFGALLAYFEFARAGLTSFGIGLVVGFLVPAFVSLFVISGIARPSRGGR